MNTKATHPALAELQAARRAYARDHKRPAPYSPPTGEHPTAEEAAWAAAHTPHLPAARFLATHLARAKADQRRYAEQAAEVNDR